MLTLVQGYIYDNTIISYSVNNLGVTKIDHLYAINVNGYLTFWFSRINYWQSYKIEVYKSSYGDYRKNHAISVVDSEKPTGTKEIDLCGVKYTNAYIDDLTWGNIEFKPLSGDSGNNGPVWGNYVPVKSDGVMEIGKYLDFHDSSNDGVDYAVRLMCQGDNRVQVNLPTGDGTLALTTQIPNNNNQLTNGAGYITSSGSCSNADMVDGYHADNFARQADGYRVSADSIPDGFIGGKLYAAENWPYSYYAFLSAGYYTYKMQFNAVNNELRFRAGDESGLSNKPWREVIFADSTTLSNYTRYYGNFSGTAPSNGSGYFAGSDGWWTWGPGIAFGINASYVQLQGDYYGTTLKARTYVGNTSTMSDWKTIWTEANSNLTTVPWSASSLTLAGAISGATSISASGDILTNTRFRVASNDVGINFGLWDGANCRLESYGYPLLITSYSQPIKIGFNGDGNALYLNTNGYIGIGTTSPSYKLDVNGPANATTLYENGNRVITTANIGSQSVSNADCLDGFHETGFQRATTSTIRDFVNGTLITTDIDYSVGYGDPFYMEIKGNTYGRYNSCFTQVQGYIYDNTIIHYGVSHLGVYHVDGIIAINVSGNLCFWFPRQGYWEGYSIVVYSAYNYRVNRITSITDSSEPSGTKRVNLASNTHYTITTLNISSSVPSLTNSEIDNIIV